MVIMITFGTLVNFQKFTKSGSDVQCFFEKVDFTGRHLNLQGVIFHLQEAKKNLQGAIFSLQGSDFNFTGRCHFC